MVAGVYGEITAAGDQIVLAVTGSDWELNRAGAALRHLTPLLTKTEPKGFLLAPLTWSTVCQLGHSFSSDSTGRWMPGAKLYQWTLDEFTRRHAARNPQSANRAESAVSPGQPATVPQSAATEVRPASQHEPAASPGQPATVPQSAATEVRPASQHEPAASSVGPAIDRQSVATTSQPAIDRQPAANAAQPAKDLVPRAYQLDAAAMIANLGKFLLFDEPGCGKTVSTILGLQRRDNLFPLVIITPSWDVADVWVRHIRDWAPDWPEPALYGGPYREKIAGSQILITTYATATRDAADAKGPLVKLKPVTVVLDEAHYCKSTEAKRTHAVTRIASRAGTIVALTGTPITRDTGDIFPVLAAIDPRSYPSRKRFVDRYLQTSTDDTYGETIEGLNPLAEPEFRTVLAGQYRRVSKADVAAELPPKIYSIRRVEIPQEWRKAYDTMEKDMLAEMPDTGMELEVMSVLAQLTRLSQLASSACDVEVTMEPDEITGELAKHYTVTLKAPSWKADCLLEILAERPGQQVAVFAESRQLAIIAGLACHEEGYRCGYLLGGMSAKSRQDGIAGFQAGELDVMLATSGAGGLGITLTAAGTAVFLQRSWELDKAIQPEDRLHRIGQKNEAVEIIDVVARRTVDERVRELLRVKGGRLAELVQDARITRELMGGIR